MKLTGTVLKISGIAFAAVAVFGGIAGYFDYVLVIQGSELPVIDFKMAVVCLVIALVLFIPGTLMVKKAVKKESSEPAPKLDINDLQFINTALKKTRKRNLIMGIFMLIFGILMISVIFLPDDAEVGTGGKIFLVILGVLCLLIGVIGLKKFNDLINIKESAIYKLIMTDPQNISALQAVAYRSNLTKVGQTINATIISEGKNKAVLVVNEKELELLKQYLLKYNPALDFSIKEQRT